LTTMRRVLKTSPYLKFENFGTKRIRFERQMMIYKVFSRRNDRHF
jgi:hypothetical protein